MNVNRLQETLQQINEFGAVDEGICRLAYTRTHKEAVDYFVSLCKEENLKVRIDAAGNVIARREGRNPESPVVACGSHLDTVVNGGRYDGTLGVVAALEVIRSLNEKGIKTVHPIEIIAFACEESSRFGISTLGSKLMAGLISKDNITNLRDKNGISIQSAFADFSLNFNDVIQAVRKPDEFKVFLELHIEQGPILEHEKKQVGIVTGIAAPTRLRLHIQGKASHSGTTPMYHRKDALVASSEIILGVEKAAMEEVDFGTVGTVGVCEVRPGAMNVIPDSVTMQVDIRGVSMESKARVAAKLFEMFAEIEHKRKVVIQCQLLCDEKPVSLHEEVASSLLDQCKRLNISSLPMMSGAGHDAMSVAHLCPTGLIFIPCRDGLSHHPDEFASMDDVAVGTELLEQEIIRQAVCYQSNEASVDTKRLSISHG